mgnify:CR=1 FL=1
MTKITDIPAIRFKGFSDTWEQRKLGDITTKIGSGKTPKGGAAAYKDDGIALIRSQNVNGDRVDLSDVVFIDEQTDEDMKNSRVLKGDVLLNITGASIGRSAVFTRELRANVNQHVCIIRTKGSDASPEFIQLNIISSNGQNQIDSFQAGGGREGLNFHQIGKMEFLYPGIEEQQKIGQYFANLDHLITLHQRKYDKLTNVKKSMLEKMFPQNGSNVPEIRFKGFTEAWEQRKLSEIATMHARIGWQNLRTSEFLDSGDYMLITGTDFIDGAVNFDTCHYVERERYEQDKHIQIRNGSILITKDGTLGKVAYIQGLTMPATLNAGVFNVEIKDENEVDNRYLFQYLKAPFLMDYVDKKATGGTIKHLNQNILVDFPVVLPHKAEQEKIGEYFLAIDHLITLHQRELEKLKNLKKACLEKMFV